MANILASGISKHEHLAAFDEMVEERLSNIDVEAVLIYLIDTVNASALPILAEQFDVLGIKGFGLVQTEEEQREVIKKAIELHRFKGTPWSIKEALKAIGYFGAEIVEGFSDDIIFYDGVHNHNGTQLYGPGHWADFAVIMDIGATQGINAQSAAAAVALIIEYKNVRSRLRYVAYQATINEIMTGITESFSLSVVSTIGESLGYYHDSVYFYNGNVTHGTSDESLSVTII
jgi:P2-related tail formation protein